MSDQHLLDSPADAVRRLLKTMSNDNQIVDQRGWLEAMEVLRRSLTVPRSQQPAEPVQAAQPDTCEVAVSEAFLAHWCRDVPPAFLQSAKDNARKRIAKGGATPELLAAFAAWAAALATTSPAPDAEPAAVMDNAMAGAAAHNDAARISKELVRLADILRDCNRLVSPEGAAETVLREAAASLALASSGGAAAGDTRRELDMAMIVRRIVSSARRHCDGNSPVLKLANEAWDYIYRSGLGGSPLRDAALPAATGLPESAPKITVAPPAETRAAEDAFEQFKAWPCTTSINNLRMRLDEAECYINAKEGISKL